MLIVSIAAALMALQAPVVDPLQLDRVTTLAKAGVIIESHAGQMQTIALHMRWDRDGGAATWSAAVSDSPPGENNVWRWLAQTDCPGIAIAADELAEIDTGPFITIRPDLRPPSASIDHHYTVWARARQSDGGSHTTRISTRTGPLAAWAEELRQTVDECLSASAQ